MDAPVGHDDQFGPEFAGLAKTLLEFRGDIPVPDDATWRLAVERSGRFTFLTDAAGSWFYATVVAEGSGWRPVNMGDCHPHLVVSEQLVAAAWWLDERVPQPTADAIELPVLIMEQACAGGSFASGRIASPLVRYTADIVVIIAGVHGIGGTCQSNPATRAIFILPEPIDERQLLDGYHVPPAPPREVD